MEHIAIWASSLKRWQRQQSRNHVFPIFSPEPQASTEVGYGIEGHEAEAEAATPSNKSDFTMVWCVRDKGIFGTQKNGATFETFFAYEERLEKVAFWSFFSHSLVFLA